MATIALAAASGFEAGTAGYALAAMLGSVIDNTLVFPSLFPADPIEGMRVGEVQIMGADEGTPAAKCYGAEAKVGGQIIWAGALQEVQTSNHSGKNTNRIEYTYYLDCAVVCCHTDGNALASIERVWADEKQVFVDPGVFNGITVTDEDGIGVYVENWSTYWIFFDETVNANVKANVYDLFSVGSRVTYTGFTNSGNNDTACEILEKRKKTFWDKAGGYGYREHYAWRVSKSKVDEFVLGNVGDNGPHGTTNLISFAEVVGNGWKTDIQQTGTPTIHLGDQTAAWSHMATTLGAANVPAFKDVAYIGFDSLALEDFGVRIPNFAFLVTNTGQNTVSAVVDDILADTGLPTSVFDTTGISSQTVLGYTRRGPVETAKALQPIMVAFNLIAQERGTTMYWMDRSAAPSITILDAYLGFASGSGSTSGGVEIQEVPVNERLGEVVVDFIDSGDNWQAGTERANAWTTISSTPGLNSRQAQGRWTSRKVNLSNLTISGDTARSIAHRLLWSSWSDCLRFKFTLPPRYLAVQENDRLTFNANGVAYNAMVTRVDVGAHFVIEVEANLDVAVDQSYDYPE
jgi:hypothetical protein